MRHLIRLAALAALLAAGCGAPAPVALVRPASTAVEAQGVPPASQFVTIECSVTKLLPDDNDGLPHQLFVVKVTKGAKPGSYQVANDTLYGQKVPDLHVGDALTIKGTLFSGGTLGIHWTHKASKPFDAGWIKTKDGKVWQ